MSLDDIEFPSIGSAARWIASEYGASEKSVAKRLRLKDTGLTFGHEFRKTPYRINIIPAPKVKVRDAYQGELRSIKGHEGTYSISRSGDVISHKRYFDKVLAPEIRGDKKRVNLAGRKLVVSDLVSAAYS